MPEEAEILEYALSLDLRALVISLVVLASVGVAIYLLVKKIQEIMGIETKSMREKRQMKENITCLKDEMDQLKQSQAESREIREQFNQRMEDSQTQVMEAINNLAENLKRKEMEDTKREIESIRWNILDFANAIRNGRKYDIEAYNHIVDVYSSYERLLQENGMENGRVTMAMNLVNEKYELGMRDGFPV